jgi:membrane protease YdiL (CAAX protease family)
MKDKRLILSWPILILTGILSLYFYVGNPLDKEFDSGLIAMLLSLSNLIILFLFKKRNYFIKQIIGIILLLVFIGIYFLLR